MAFDQLSSDPAFLAAYGAVVRQMREEHGFDRKDFATEAGISYSYLSAIESGQKLPSVAVQDALAAALGVETSGLLARANGQVETAPLPSAPSLEMPMRASMVLADMAPMSTVRADEEMAPVEREASSMPSSEAGISPTGALAELQALVPSLSPEDAAMVVSVARRLAGGSEPRRRTSSGGRYRGSPGRFGSVVRFPGGLY